MWRLIVKRQSTIFAVFVSKFAIRMKNLPTYLRRRTLPPTSLSRETMLSQAVSTSDTAADISADVSIFCVFCGTITQSIVSRTFCGQSTA